jgi:hypothetical protein
MVAMQMKWRYVWNAEREPVRPEMRNAVLVKRGIVRMMMDGCDVKKLKNEMKKLETLNAAML